MDKANRVERQKRPHCLASLDPVVNDRLKLYTALEERQIAMNAKHLIAIIEQPDQENAAPIFVLDLLNDEALAPNKINNLAQLDQDTLLIFADAKAQLRSMNHDSNSGLKIICLSTIKKLISKSPQEKLKMPRLDSAQAACLWVKKICQDAFERIIKLKLENLVALECEVILATLTMEKIGIPFDKNLWRQTLSNIEERQSKVESRLLEILPKPKAEGFLLFDEVKGIDLNSQSLVKLSLEQLLNRKLISTSHSSLKDIDHEAVKLLLLHREQARMLSVYGANFLLKLSDSRLRGYFTPIGSSSGRFACSDLNLLALPNHEDFQACIKPDPGFELLYFDYGAFELRILAALSNDKILIDIFNRGLDIHSMVAQEIFHTEVSKHHNVDLRNQAKALNFGLIYGMGEKALARELKISLSEAEELQRRYFARFIGVRDFLYGLEKMAARQGYVSTALGRRAYFHSDRDSRNAAQLARVARNIPIQGTGADIIKLAFCRVHKALRQAKLNAHVINVVHDEIVLECAQADRDRASALVMSEMQAAFNAICPNVAVEVSIS